MLKLIYECLLLKVSLRLENADRLSIRAIVTVHKCCDSNILLRYCHMLSHWNQFADRIDAERYRQRFVWIESVVHKKRYATISKEIHFSCEQLLWCETVEYQFEFCNEFSLNVFFSIQNDRPVQRNLRVFNHHVIFDDTRIDMQFAVCASNWNSWVNQGHWFENISIIFFAFVLFPMLSLKMRPIRLESLHHWFWCYGHSLWFSFFVNLAKY